jgi:hypothetical protein
VATSSTAILAGHRLEIRSPRRLEARAGSDLAIELDIELAEPWLERPRLGRAVRDVDGHAPSGLVMAFECEKPASVPALLSGTAQASDTRIDVHTPAGFPDAGAGRGHELTIVAPGGFRVTYGHLARGSAKTGLVRAGEAVGATGNTGRCIDGCGKSFVAIEVKGARFARSLEELFAPIEVELLVDGKSRGAKTLPAGETRLSAFPAGRVAIPRDQGRSACALEIRLQRRRAVLASIHDEIQVHV